MGIGGEDYLWSSGVLDCPILKPQCSWDSCLEALGLFQIKFVILLML